MTKNVASSKNLALGSNIVKLTPPNTYIESRTGQANTQTNRRLIEMEISLTRAEGEEEK